MNAIKFLTCVALLFHSCNCINNKNINSEPWGSEQLILIDSSPILKVKQRAERTLVKGKDSLDYKITICFENISPLSLLVCVSGREDDVINDTYYITYPIMIEEECVFLNLKPGKKKYLTELINLSKAPYYYFELDILPNFNEEHFSYFNTYRYDKYLNWDNAIKGGLKNYPEQGVYSICIRNNDITLKHRHN